MGRGHTSQLQGPRWSADQQHLEGLAGQLRLPGCQPLLLTVREAPSGSLHPGSASLCGVVGPCQSSSSPKYRVSGSPTRHPHRASEKWVPSTLLPFTCQCLRPQYPASGPTPNSSGSP